VLACRAPQQPVNAQAKRLSIIVGHNEEENMRRLATLGLATFLAAGVPALAGEIPFAAPPPPMPGESGTYLAPLAEIMGKIQLRHIKLWEAIKHRNWGLLDYELDRTNNTFSNAVILYRNIPVEFIAEAGKSLSDMQKAAKAKDGTQVERAYTELTAACNNCHRAAGAGFIIIKTPASSPFGNQEFSPREK
jgi:hypothetical protein